TTILEHGNDSCVELLRHSESAPEIKAETSCFDCHGREHIVAWQVRHIDSDPSRLLIGTDLTESRRADRALQAVIATAARESGARLVERITRALCDYLDTDVAYAATVRGGNAHVMAGSSSRRRDAATVDLPARFPLRGTPGETVMQTNWVLVGHAVAQRYPGDAFLQQWHMTGYAGIAMHASDGRPLGLLCTLSRSPLALPPQAREVFDILADRIAAELERERVVAELRASQRHLAQAQRIAGLGTWSWDPKRDRLSWSAEAAAIFAYAGDATPPSRDTFLAHVHPDDRERVQLAFQDCLRDHQPMKMEYRIHDAQGALHYLTESAEAITEGNGPDHHISGTVVDVSAHRQMQEHLNHSEKMRAIGQLAGGIAHDFNNQLTGILGFSEFLEDLLDNERLRGYATNIRISAERASQLTQQLLSFARRGRMQQVPVDAHAIIHEVLQILHHTLDKRIELQERLQAERTELRGDPSQLQNAILNLAINASDAMPQGGILGLRTWNESCRGTDGKEHDCLTLEISDSGVGMSPELVAHIFEPFFTTKESGQGTGMGLAAVEGTVGQHGGTIDVESAPDQGSRFILKLPLGPLPPIAEPTPVRSDQLAAAGQQQSTILVVDDEETIRALLQDMLEDMGHEVRSAAGGSEAQQQVRENGGDIDLVLLDLMMPPPDGSTTFAALHGMRPDLPIVIMSGYARSGSAQALLDAGAQAFLQKPFDRTGLERLLTEILPVRP
ncbi:MAG: hybrid sensor histidine kinase/response regulator, partial [Planctomycetota bacterium]